MTTDTDPNSDNNGPPRRTRLEDEVLEILTRADRPPTRWEKIRSWRWRSRRWQQRARPRCTVKLGNGTWLLASVATGLLALFVAGPSPLLARLLALACIVCFAMPIVKRWRKPEEPEIKRWRGRDIDFHPPAPTFFDDVKQWFRRYRK